MRHAQVVAAAALFWWVAFAGVRNASSRNLQASDVCTSGIDVTSAPYRADATGAADSSPAFNAAIAAASAAGKSIDVSCATWHCLVSKAHILPCMIIAHVG